MRSSVFKTLSPTDINQLITEFTHFFVKDKTIIDPEAYPGFIICLEGKINYTQEGCVFNEEGWVSKTYKGSRLMKNEDGACCFLAFKKAEALLENLGNKKKAAKLYKKNTAPKNKIYLKDFQYLKKLGEGQFGQVFLVKNMQYGTNLYAIKCLSKDEIRK